MLKGFSLNRVINIVSGVVLLFAIYQTVDFKNMVNISLVGYEKCLADKVVKKLCNSLWIDTLADLAIVNRYLWIIGLGLPSLYYVGSLLLPSEKKVQKVGAKKRK